MVALAVEESGLHRRIALRALSLAVRKSSQMNTNNREMDLIVMYPNQGTLPAYLFLVF